MTGDQQDVRDARRALELADGHLMDAQDVLWTTATELEAGELQQPLEALTEEIWAIQHHLHELQRDLER